MTEMMVDDASLMWQQSLLATSCAVLHHLVLHLCHTSLYYNILCYTSATQSSAVPDHLDQNQH